MRRRVASRLRRPLRFAVLGAGFWADYQLAAWNELQPSARCVAIYNRTRAKAERLALKFGIPAVYDDPGQLLAVERPDFVDIITAVETHAPLVLLAARHRVPVICQKPMAASLAEAERMVSRCRAARVPLLIHENWRWQTPIRRLKAILDSGAIGRPFRARIDMISGFRGWINQPALLELEQFILTDLGSHILDTARFLFGEPQTLYCQTQRTLKQLRGENVATVVLHCSGATVICEMAYAETPLARECFPQTLFFIEGPSGLLEVTPDYWIHLTRRSETLSRRYPPPHYPWADPNYDVVHASIVDCHRDLLRSLSARGASETSGKNNLKTMRLVFGAYESAASRRVVKL